MGKSPYAELTILLPSDLNVHGASRRIHTNFREISCGYLRRASYAEGGSWHSIGGTQGYCVFQKGTKAATSGWKIVARYCLPQPG